MHLRCERPLPQHHAGADHRLGGGDTPQPRGPVLCPAGEEQQHDFLQQTEGRGLRRRAGEHGDRGGGGIRRLRGGLRLLRIHQLLHALVQGGEETPSGGDRRFHLRTAAPRRPSRRRPLCEIQTDGKAHLRRGVSRP